jgi:hypothetical protein
MAQMSDRNVEQGQQHSHGNARNRGGLIPVEVFQLGTPSVASVMTRSTGIGIPGTIDTPSGATMGSVEEEMEAIADPLEAEETYDRHAHNDAPGAEDSEGEDEDDDEDQRALQLDRAIHEAENIAVLIRDADLVLSKTETIDEAIELEGAPPGWKRPGPPKDWVPPSAKNGVPEFNKVDNPGGWSSFTFQPKFKKVTTAKGKSLKYIYHASAAGATPVPKVRGKQERERNGWKFHYTGWDAPLPVYRSGATKGNMFPECRKGSLDGDILIRLGMTEARMLGPDGAPDALFFYQLLFPIVDPVNSGIKDDPRKAFYSKVSLFTNLYAVGELNLGNGMGHKWVNTDGPELLRWDGVCYKDGVLGGSHGAILRRFDSRKDNAAYDEATVLSMHKTRWLELKRTVKLCNNLTSPKRGEPGYNPAYKYDLIYDVLVHNTNAITKRAGLDLCGDETSWAHQGFAEKGTGVTSNIIGKPGVSKGGQTVLVSDTDRIRIRAYIHRHKLHHQHYSIAGQNEVYLIWQKLKVLVNNEDNIENVHPSRRGIFSEKPHITWDNFFSGQKIMEYAASEGFGLTMTCRRDRLPVGIEKQYLHVDPTGTGPRSRHGRFENPIFLWKPLPNGTMLQHCSFQSTGPTNLSCVNALNGCHLYAATKQRGRGFCKYKWAIEMNEARELYLATYGKIDTIDHYVQNCDLGYR